MSEPYDERTNGDLDEAIQNHMDDLADEYSAHPRVLYITGIVKDILAIKSARTSCQEVMNRID